MCVLMALWSELKYWLVDLTSKSIVLCARLGMHQIKSMVVYCVPFVQVGVSFFPKIVAKLIILFLLHHLRISLGLLTCSLKSLAIILCILFLC